LERDEMKAIVENLLLAADQPVTLEHLRQTFSDKNDKAQLGEVLNELTADYQSKNLQITEVADGYQLCTRKEYSDWVRKFLKLDKTFRLSQAALDTLSIVAYKQPLTRAEIDNIRGVDSGGALRTLLEKKIIGPGGRKDVAGRPFMYRTTRKFLEYFGLGDLSDLPTLEDFQASHLDEIEGPMQTEISFEGATTATIDDGNSEITNNDLVSSDEGTSSSDLPGSE
jgi:segregation and condensation protein B